MKRGAAILVGLLCLPLATAATVPRSFQYTRTDRCRTLETNADEGGWSVQLCPGLAGYRLKVTEGDLRQNVVVLLPGRNGGNGGERSLALAETTGSGGFSSVGPTVEWRGTGQGRGFRPDALILRYSVVEDPERPERPTSYLLAVSLAGRRPCVTAKIAPGLGQNERARAAADRPGRCLA
ncbi:MAG: hypothetical protein QM676_10975 [Novosphingobium sp.]